MGREDSTSAQADARTRRKRIFLVIFALMLPVTYEDVPALDTYRDTNLKTGDGIEGEKFPLLRPALSP